MFISVTCKTEGAPLIETPMDKFFFFSSCAGYTKPAITMKVCDLYYIVVYGCKRRQRSKAKHKVKIVVSDYSLWTELQFLDKVLKNQNGGFEFR